MSHPVPDPRPPARNGRRAVWARARQRVTCSQCFAPIALGEHHRLLLEGDLLAPHAVARLCRPCGDVHLWRYL